MSLPWKAAAALLVVAVSPALPTPAPEKVAHFTPSGDRFAYAVRSEAAGFTIVKVLRSADSTVLQEFRLEDGEAIEEARSYLLQEEVRHPPATTHERQKGVRIHAKVEDGVLVVWREGGRGTGELFRGKPFGDSPPAGTPAATVLGFSPDGRWVAVQVDVDTGHHGKARTVRLVEAPFLSEARRAKP